MIAPRKSGRRNRGGAGEAARPVSARKNGIRLTWILYLDNNSLTGSIPSELGDLGSLHRLKFNHTSLTGPIPGNFTDISLQQFHWHETDLCAPGDDEFRDWLDSIDDHMGGDTCPGS